MEKHSACKVVAHSCFIVDVKLPELAPYMAYEIFVEHFCIVKC